VWSAIRRAWRLARPIASAESSWPRVCRFSLEQRAPDDELLRVAEQGRLTDPAVLDAQVRRMLAIPGRRPSWTTSRAKVELRKFGNVQPNSDLFPDFDDNFRQGFKRETELFFESVMRADRPVTDLMIADYTFVNRTRGEALRFPGVYGKPVPSCDADRRASIRTSRQRQCAAVSSHAERTSPVLVANGCSRTSSRAPCPLRA